MRKLGLALACAAFLSLGAFAEEGLRPPSKQSRPKPAAKGENKPAEEESASAKAVEKIFQCIAQGLPKDWRQARIVVSELSGDEKERRFEGKFEYSTAADGSKPAPLKPCDAREVAQGVYSLNEFLSPEKRLWKVATLTFTSEGKFEIKYDYVK